MVVRTSLRCRVCSLLSTSSYDPNSRKRSMTSSSHPARPIALGPDDVKSLGQSISRCGVKRKLAPLRKITAELAEVGLLSPRVTSSSSSLESALSSSHHPVNLEGILSAMGDLSGDHQQRQQQHHPISPLGTSDPSQTPIWNTEHHHNLLHKLLSAYQVRCRPVLNHWCVSRTSFSHVALAVLQQCGEMRVVDSLAQVVWDLTDVVAPSQLGGPSAPSGLEPLPDSLLLCHQQMMEAQVQAGNSRGAVIGMRRLLAYSRSTAAPPTTTAVEVRIFNMLISALCNPATLEKLQVSQELFDDRAVWAIVGEMQRCGCPPTSDSYKPILDAYAACGMSQAALNLIRKARCA